MLKRIVVTVMMAALMLAFGGPAFAQQETETRSISEQVELARAQGADPLLDILIASQRDLASDIERVSSNGGDVNPIKRAAASNIAATAVRLAEMGIGAVLNDAILLAGGEGAIAAELATDRTINISFPEALDAVRTLQESGLSKSLIDVADAIRSSCDEDAEHRQEKERLQRICDDLRAIQRGAERVAGVACLLASWIKSPPSPPAAVITARLACTTATLTADLAKEVADAACDRARDYPYPG